MLIMATKDYKYTNATPVDEPVVKPKASKPAPTPKPAPQPPMYPDSVPVDEPVKKMASGGFTRSADGIAQRGKTRAQQFCGGGMTKGRK